MGATGAAVLGRDDDQLSTTSTRSPRRFGIGFPCAIRIDQPHASALASLSSDLRAPALAGSLGPSSRRVSLRRFYAFDELRRHLGAAAGRTAGLWRRRRHQRARRVDHLLSRVSEIVHPELVTGRDDDFVNAPWTVKPGTTRRGEASCNLTERILEVPLGSDATVSRRSGARVDARSGQSAPHRALRRARGDGAAGAGVRRRTSHQHPHRPTSISTCPCYVMDPRRSGHGESPRAQDWSEAICFLMAVVGTGGEKEYLAGIRQVAPSWMPGLRAVRKRALGLFDSFTSANLGATRVNDESLPSGYANATVVLARLLTQSMMARPPKTPEELRAFRRSLEPGGRRPPTGRFAPLVFDATVAMSRRAARCRRTPRAGQYEWTDNALSQSSPHRRSQTSLRAAFHLSRRHRHHRSVRIDGLR